MQIRQQKKDVHGTRPWPPARYRLPAPRPAATTSISRMIRPERLAGPEWAATAR